MRKKRLSAKTSRAIGAIMLIAVLACIVLMLCAVGSTFAQAVGSILAGSLIAGWVVLAVHLIVTGKD